MAERKELELKYRPLDFDEIIGWDTEKKSLLSILNTKRTYLLYGPRGCGKTTTSRLIAHRLEIDDIDIKEIDAATNTGVDDARAIKSNSALFPLKSKNKIYIIDEVHRLSPQAFDALLKTLEEPPEHCYFVLLTSEVDKIPATIKSRCARYEVKPLNKRDSLELLDWICDEEKIIISPAVKEAIISNNDGVPREMIISLEMVKDIKSEDEAISLIISTKGNAQLMDLCKSLLEKKDWKKISAILKSLNEEPENIRYGVLNYMNAVLLNGGNERAAMIGMNFSDSFMYSKKFGLTLACLMSIKD